MPALPKVVVLGAGVLGLSIAAELARARANVTIVSAPAGHRSASLRSFSWINSLGTHPPAYHALRLRGMTHYRRLAADWLRFDGSLTWRAEDAAAHLQTLHAHARSIAYPLHWIDPAEALRLEPALAEAAAGSARILHAPEEGWVDLPPLLDILRNEIATAGGRVREIPGAATPFTRDGRVVGLRLADRTLIEADAVIIAAGAATPGIVAEFGVVLPERTNRALLLHARSTGVGPRAVLRGPDVAIRARADGTLAIHADWADARVQTRDTDHFEVADEVVNALLEKASQALAGTPRLELLKRGIGLRPIPGDGFSVVGAIDGVPGAYVAFSHSAATLAPAIAEALAPEVLGGAPDPRLGAFRLSRFEASERIETGHARV